MGVNLVPLVDHPRIRTRNFTEDSHIEVIEHSLEDGCVTVGQHTYLAFDMLCYNKGDTDLVVGDPRTGPFKEYFELSKGHSHYHLKDFNTYNLTSKSGIQVFGKKQAFALEDSTRLSGNRNQQFSADVNNQGITSGWADRYNWYLACQFIVIEDENGQRIPNGEYTLEAITNAPRANGKRIFPEDTYEDNSITRQILIQTDSAQFL